MVEPTAKKQRVDIEARIDICFDLLPIMDLSLKCYDPSGSLVYPFLRPLPGISHWSTRKHVLEYYTPRLKEKVLCGLCKPSVYQTLHLILEAFPSLYKFGWGHFPQQIHEYCVDMIEGFLKEHGHMIPKSDRRRLLRYSFGIGREMDIKSLYELCEETEQSTFFHCSVTRPKLDYMQDSRLNRPILVQKVHTLKEVLKPGDNPAFLYYAFLMDLYSESAYSTIFTKEWKQLFLKIAYPPGTTSTLQILDGMGPAMLGVEIWDYYYFRKINEENEKLQKSLPFPGPVRELSLFPLQVLERTERRWRACYFAVAFQCNCIIMASLMHHMPWQTLN